MFTTNSCIQETHIIACEKIQEHVHKLCPGNKTHRFGATDVSINNNKKWWEINEVNEHGGTNKKDGLRAWFVSSLLSSYTE